jgi:hypothetical protein
VHELHGVIKDGVFLATVNDRYDVRVLQPGGGPRFSLESFHGARISRKLKRQDLQRDVPA